MPLIDPSVQGLANAGLPGSLLSFSAPCFKWKLFAACHIHWGANGFDPTISPANKYLTQTVVYSNVINGETISDSGTFIQNIDRISSAVTGPQPPGGTTTFLPQTGIGLLQVLLPPAGTTIGPFGGNGTTTVVVEYIGDTRLNATLTQTAPGWNQVRAWTITLSNQYSFAMLDEDLDALIATIDPDNYPIQTLTPVAYAADGNPAGAARAMAAIPTPYNYPFMDSPPFVSFANVHYPVSSIAAAAISAYNPGTGGPSNAFSGPGMMKLVGWLAMAGDYALTTYSINYSGQQIAPVTCQDGQGTCSDWFFVEAPPATSGQNNFMLPNPNHTCALLGF